MPTESLVIYWSRRDFRLSDNRALTAAIEESKERSIPLLSLFILEDYMCAGDPVSQFGFPSRLFLAKALPTFVAQFPSFFVVQGKALKTIRTLAETFAITIHVNEDIHPDFFAQVERLRATGISVKVYADRLSVPKDTRTGAGAIYSVFTPFKNAVRERFVQIAPAKAANPKEAIPLSSELKATLESKLKCIAPTEENIMQEFSQARTFTVQGHIFDIGVLLPEIRAESVLDTWYTTEKEVLAHFDTYLSSGGMDIYGIARDSLTNDAEGAETSKMSLALAWGLISTRIMIAHIQNHYEDTFEQVLAGSRYDGAEKYISELIWREFYAYLLYHRPDLLTTEFQQKFIGTVHWINDAEAVVRFTAWIQGQTGYPLVDAAMKQLAHTGWMHNRSRMVVASVLTKNFGVDWRWGQEYFRAALLDLDEASNNGGWQWGASVGADPKPIRIFNPELQAKTHDPKQQYQQKWLSAEYLANPPVAVVPHSQAREEALQRYGLGGVKPRDF